MQCAVRSAMHSAGSSAVQNKVQYAVQYKVSDQCNMQCNVQCSTQYSTQCSMQCNLDSTIAIVTTIVSCIFYLLTFLGPFPFLQLRVAYMLLPVLPTQLTWTTLALKLLLLSGQIETLERLTTYCVKHHPGELNIRMLSNYDQQTYCQHSHKIS